MKTVWFIRHGQSASNAGQSTSDPGSVPLTETGAQQARDVVDQILNHVALAQAKPTSVIVSSYARTRATAQPLLDHVPGVPVRQWNIHELTYLAPARCVDTNVEQRRGMVGEYWQRADPDFVHGTGAESFDQFMRRVLAVREQIDALEQGWHIVYGHGQFLFALMFAWAYGYQTSAEWMLRYRDEESAHGMHNGQILRWHELSRSELWSAQDIERHIGPDQALQQRLRDALSANAENHAADVRRAGWSKDRGAMRKAIHKFKPMLDILCHPAVKRNADALQNHVKRDEAQAADNIDYLLSQAQLQRAFACMRQFERTQQSLVTA